jgi:HCOMODA/2-hydroxy-3-carboxy-muconic semialdehyde decarboxylase
VKILSAYGHVSVRNPGNPNRYFISRDVSPGIVRAADIYESDLDSRPVQGDPTQYSERFIHGEIYKARPDVMAIVHSHTAELVTFGQSSVPLRPVANAAAFIGAALPNYDIRTFTDGFASPVGCAHCISTPALGRALAAVLGTSGAALLLGHGVVIVDSSLPDLVSRSYNLRINARIQQMAIDLGGSVGYLDGPARGTSGGGAEFNRDWDYWKRRVSVR